jgi:hypothetical protein
MASQAGILGILDKFLLASWGAEKIPFSFMENTRGGIHEFILCSTGSEHAAANHGQRFRFFFVHYPSP